MLKVCYSVVDVMEQTNGTMSWMQDLPRVSKNYTKTSVSSKWRMEPSHTTVQIFICDFCY